MPRVRFRRQSLNHKEAEEWGNLFEYGWTDYFGIEHPPGSRQFPFWSKDVPPDIVRAQWHKLGESYLANRSEQNREQREFPWALREFGPPPGDNVVAISQRRRR